MTLYDINGNPIAVGSGGYSVLFGKKWAVCGDSITSGEHAEKDENGNYKTYAWFIAERNNMTLYRDGISGSTITNRGVYHDFSVSRYKNIPADCDYITLWFGINDPDNAIGTIDDTENTTMYGAYNTVIPYLIQNHPNAKIGLIVSHQIGTKAEVIRDIAHKYGLGIFDIQGDEKIPFWAGLHERTYVDKDIADFRMANWLADGQHPNTEGYYQISTSMEAWLKTL